MKLLLVPVAALSAAAFVCPAQAGQIPNGTVSIAALFSPTVNLSVDPATYTASFGTTFQVAGTGGLSDAAGLFGTMNGTLLFSATPNTTIAQSVTDFFVFNDGHSGTYHFSVDSVKTLSYVVNSTQSAIGLSLLGSTWDSNLGYDPTPTNFTLTFNNTNGSHFSASATLGAVPEPASWAMMLAGFGAIGGMLRSRRHRVAVQFAK